MEGIISMSAKELERITVMDNLLAKRIKQKHAAAQLGVTIRQIRRLKKRYKASGATGLVHKGRGHISNRAIAQTEKDRAIALVNQYYPDFGPTFAQEKLVEHHGIYFGVDTLRKEMIIHHLWTPKKRTVIVTHPYRERRSCMGELIQLDGSPHPWFEDRADPCTLIVFIDDATSSIMDGAFVDYEGTFTFFAVTEHYLVTHGKPLAWYVDKHSTFRVNRQATVEEELKDQQAKSQFGRAMDTLSIALILAHSAEAKGRVERLFETLQDRLVKELRLEGISSKEEGTRYFRQVYIPKHNAKFAVPAKEKANLHRPLLPTDDLTRIFTVQSMRRVTKDLIVQYKNTRYQLVPLHGYRYTLRNQAVIVEEGRCGMLAFRYNGQVIPYTVAVQEVQTSRFLQVASSKTFQERRVVIPPADHPWRRNFVTV